MYTFSKTAITKGEKSAMKKPASFWMIFCGWELLGIFGSLLAGAAAGADVQISNVAREPQTGWEAAIAHLDYPAFFLFSGAAILLFTAVWLAASLFLSRRIRKAPGKKGFWIGTGVCVFLPALTGLLSGFCFPARKLFRLIGSGTQVLSENTAAVSFDLSSCLLTFGIVLAGTFLIWLGIRASET